MATSNEGSPPDSHEPLQRETLFVYNDRHRLGLLLVVAALGGVGVGFGLATMAYQSRGLPPLAVVAPFDVGPRATPSRLRGPRVAGHLYAHRGCEPGAAPGLGFAHRSGPLLGVQLQSLSDELAGALKLPDGVAGGAVVTWVFRDTPASAAGIAAGDVILAIDGAAIGDAGDVVRAVRGRAAGDEIEITVARDGARKAVSATLAPAAANDNE